MSATSPQPSCNRLSGCMFDYLGFVARVNQVFEDPPSIDMFLRWGRGVLSQRLSASHMLSSQRFDDIQNEEPVCFSFEQFGLLLQVLSASYVAGVNLNNVDENKSKIDDRAKAYDALLNEVKAQFSSYWCVRGQATYSPSLCDKRQVVEVDDHQHHSAIPAPKQGVVDDPIDKLTDSTAPHLTTRESELGQPQVAEEIEYIELNDAPLSRDVPRIGYEVDDVIYALFGDE